MNHSFGLMKTLFIFLSCSLTLPAWTTQITRSCTVNPGPVNGALIRRDGKSLAIYHGPKTADTLLLTHHRRDVTATALENLDESTIVVAPAAAEELFSKTGEHWEAFWKKRFHYYTQQSTKILVEPMKVGRWVKDGDKIVWQDLKSGIKYNKKMENNQGTRLPRAK